MATGNFIGPWLVVIVATIVTSLVFAIFGGFVATTMTSMVAYYGGATGTATFVKNVFNLFPTIMLVSLDIWAFYRSIVVEREVYY